LGQATATGIPINAIAHHRAGAVMGTANFWNTAFFYLDSGVMKSLTLCVCGMSGCFY